VLLFKSNASGVLTLGHAENAREVQNRQRADIELRSAYLNDLGLADHSRDVSVGKRRGESNHSLIWVDERQRLGGILREKGTDRRLSTVHRFRRTGDAQRWPTCSTGVKYSIVPRVGSGPAGRGNAGSTVRQDCISGGAHEHTTTRFFEDQYEPWLDSYTTVNDSSPIRMNLLPLSSRKSDFLFQLDGQAEAEIVTQGKDAARSRGEVVDQRVDQTGVAHPAAS
jgi:hypothetical protein